MSELSLRQRIERGREIAGWSEGPGGLFEIMEALIERKLSHIAATEPEAAAKREAIFFEIRALKSIREELSDLMRDGNNARQLLESKGSQYF